MKTKVGIQRISPHQNGKVISIITAFVSMLIYLPIFLYFIGSGAYEERGYGPAVLLLFLPVVYLVFTYVAVTLVCVIYNSFHKHIGGLEVYLEDHSQHQHHDE